jgi:hypothetical protein
MRSAFVLQLAAESDVARLHFVGFIEEVDTARELRFKSTAELLRFLAECYEEANKQKQADEAPDK